MTHTYTQLVYHFVWSTKDRLPLIQEGIQERLYEYLGGTIRNLHGICLEVGGMPDHVHLLATVAPRIALADFMRELKASSTRWYRSEFRTQPERGFAWQEGYGAFSVSRSKLQAVRKYIQTQEEHHRERSFKDEFLEMLDLAEIDYDERYLWK